MMVDQSSGGSDNLLKQLEDDSELREFFSAYLQQQVFPVSLDYERINGSLCLIDPSLSHLELWQRPDIQQSLHHWLEQKRYKFFVRSKLFSEYKFCQKLAEKLGKASDTINYHMFLTFKDQLERSCPALVQYNIWIAIDGCLQSTKSHTQDGINMIKYTAMKKVFSEQLANLCLPSSPLSLDAAVCFMWCKETQQRIMDRLAFYWWPSMNTEGRGTSTPIILTANRKYMSLLEKLQANCAAGDPFLDHLVHGLNDDDPSSAVTPLLYGLWREVNEVLLYQTVYSSYELQRICIKLYNKYYKGTVLLGSEVHWQLPPSESCDYHVLLESLSTLQNELVVFLESKWTNFEVEDYESFYSCFGNVEDREKVDANLRTTQETPTTRFPSISSVSSKRRRSKSSTIKSVPKYDTVLSLTDLTKTPFEGITEMDILDDFGQYLEEKYGLNSLQLSSYQLWQCILLYKKLPPSTREHSARKIYRKFFSKSAKKHSVLHSVYDGSSLIRSKSHRTISFLFEQMQSTAAEGFSKQIRDFFNRKGDSESSGSGGGVSAASSGILSNSKTDVKDENPTPADIQKLKELIMDTTGLQFTKLKAFEVYLGDNGTKECPGIMVHNLHFWREIEKLQDLVEGCAGSNILMRKIEAVIENYLDADTPPWVKISIQTSAAKEIMDKYETISEDHSFEENQENMLDLLVRAQATVFPHILQHWTTFNKTYVSKQPTPSHVSSASISTVKSSRVITPSYTHVCLSAGPRRKSVLSFTRQEGLQWTDQSFPSGRLKSITPNCSSRLA